MREPVARYVAASVAADAAAQPIAVPGNDEDPDGDRLTIVSFTQPQFGTVTRGPGGTLTCRAPPNYIGYESFTCEVGDGKGGSASATVVVYADP